jgi:hypothetical protein
MDWGEGPESMKLKRAWDSKHVSAADGIRVETANLPKRTPVAPGDDSKSINIYQAFNTMTRMMRGVRR